ncbi:FkbM family methyltransferase [Actinocorallia longicatena]|uniref:Methyltransferase FkbM domain-containing protein n=1 Tax=Actinocorallia longicatena TaxID=111803 RepID=A0ABP6PWF5_9ACTN
MIASSSAALAGVLPRPLLGRLVRSVYPRLEPELGRLAEFVPAGGTALDVGGWFGPWTQRLLARADRVVTVEADPEMAALLARTFPRARVIAAAASDTTGTASFAATAVSRLAGTSTVSAGGATVPCVRLDDLDLTDVRFLKLDIEGHELPALRGAAQTVRRDEPAVLLELEARHQPIEPVISLLESWGYRGSVLHGGRWIPLRAFDLEGHQRDHVGELDRGFAGRLLRPEPRYVNSVLFLPEN